MFKKQLLLAEKIAKEYGAHVIEGDAIYDGEMDIYAPCALGATLNDDTIDRLQCSVVAGAANNQLLDEEVHGKRLMEKGIVYAPDFLINAGGLINVYREVEGISEARAMELTENIYHTTLDIFKKSAKEGLTPQIIQYKTIEAYRELSKSPNAKLIIGSGQQPILMEP